LLETAKAAFAEKGSAASLDEIARIAGVGAGLAAVCLVIAGAQRGWRDASADADRVTPKELGVGWMRPERLVGAGELVHPGPLPALRSRAQGHPPSRHAPHRLPRVS